MILLWRHKRPQASQFLRWTPDEVSFIRLIIILKDRHLEKSQWLLFYDELLSDIIMTSLCNSPESVIERLHCEVTIVVTFDESPCGIKMKSSGDLSKSRSPCDFILMSFSHNAMVMVSQGVPKWRLHENHKVISFYRLLVTCHKAIVTVTSQWCHQMTVTWD